MKAYSELDQAEKESIKEAYVLHGVGRDQILEEFNITLNCFIHIQKKYFLVKLREQYLAKDLPSKVALAVKQREGTIVGLLDLFSEQVEMLQKKASSYKKKGKNLPLQDIKMCKQLYDSLASAMVREVKHVDKAEQVKTIHVNLPTTRIFKKDED